MKRLFSAWRILPALLALFDSVGRVSSRRLIAAVASLSVLTAVACVVYAQDAPTPGSVAQPLPSPQPSSPASPQASPLATPQAIVAALKSGGYIVYFRHTATDFSQNDERMRDYDDCVNQRNLTADGREQAKKIGDAWRKTSIPVGRVLASPYCRTREVAQLAFGRYERALDVRGGPGTAGDPVRYQPLSKLLETSPARGTNDVISSHGNPFRALHPDLPYLQEGEAAIIRPLPGGGHQVVGRILRDQWPTR